jgi:hypothetical protein
MFAETLEHVSSHAWAHYRAFGEFTLGGVASHGR